MDKLFSLQGKNILIVGASSGIGQHAAQLFVERGANVFLAARRKLLLEKIASDIGGTSRVQ